MVLNFFCFFFFKQKTEYEMRISDWSSDVCSSDLAWIVAHNDEAQRLLARVKLRLRTTDAFVLDRLTGRCVTDITTASRTSLMNLASGAWDAELCRLFKVPIEALPEIHATTGDFGATTVGGRRVPVVASVVDQQAALYGDRNSVV